MANVQHSALTGASLHELKGVSSATTDTVATASSGATVWQKLTASHLTGTGNSFGGQLLNVVDSKASGTDGGSFSAGDWRTRTLQTVRTNLITSATLSSNKINLPVGDYYIFATIPAYGVGTSTTRLWNDTSGALLIEGSGTVSTSGNMVNSIIFGKFTLAGTRDVIIQHRCSTTNAADGFGKAANFGSSDEIYTQVSIWKIG